MSTIETIEAIPLAVPFSSRSKLPAWRGRDYGALEVLLIRIRTSDGLTGWGEAFSYNCQAPVKSAVETMLAPMLVGRDARNITGLMYEVQRLIHLYGRSGIVNYGLSGIDIALWDLAGKRANTPLAEMLGGRMRSTVDGYASLFRFGEPQLVAEAAQQAIDDGYRRVKVHTRSPADVRAAREAIGPDTVLMADTNCAWNVAEAFEMARKLQEFDLKWLEEPLYPPEDFATLARLRAETGVPIALGENACSAYEFQKILAANAATYVQPSVIKVGGVTEFRKVITLAEAHGVTLAPHSPYYGPGFLATLHLIASQPEPCFIEHFNIGLEGRPYGANAEPRGGAFDVPRLPGLGFDPDPDYLAQFAVQGHS